MYRIFVSARMRTRAIARTCDIKIAVQELYYKNIFYLVIKIFMLAGTHIMVQRPDGLIAAGMIHHGINLGDNTVIHFTGNSIKEAMIIRTNIVAFERGDRSIKMDYEKLKKLKPMYDSTNRYIEFSKLEVRNPHEVLYWTFQCLGMQNYDPVVNNCEHFATCMMTGEPFSLQAAEKTNYLHNKPSLGAFLSTYLIEQIRWKANPSINPRPLPKTQFLYAHNDVYYLENYDSVNSCFPSWWFSYNVNSQWNPVDFKAVPYPLQQIG